MGFRYHRDPLFCVCVALYFLNRLILKPLWPGSFCHTHLNDLICIPFWVPLMLWLMRRLRWRKDDPPHGHEILIPLLLWSVVFELWLPHTAAFARVSFVDPADVAWYAVGALVAGLWWRWFYRTAALTPPTPGSAVRWR